MTAYGLSSDVSVNNFPAVQQVTTTGSLLITGSVGIGGPISLDRGTSASTPLFITGSLSVAAVEVQQVTGSVIVSTAAPAPSYMASTNGIVSIGISSGSTTSIGYLFHPSSSSRNVRLHRVVASLAGGAGGVITLRGAFMSAENGVPGGVAQQINPVDRSDVASEMTFRTSAASPTRINGDLTSVVTMGGVPNVVIYESDDFNKSITLRSGTSEGFEVRATTDLAATTPASVALYFYWRES